jgi:ribosomal protein S18 acetylase RimI-like enzyme
VFRALGVAPQQRSRGAGRALASTRIDRASAVGADVLGLHTASFMTAAVDLYVRAGFRRAPSFDITPAAILDVHGDDLPPVLAYVRDVA